MTLTHTTLTVADERHTLMSSTFFSCDLVPDFHVVLGEDISVPI